MREVTTNLLRSSKTLQSELELLRHLIELRRDVLNDSEAGIDPEPWDEFEYENDLVELRELTSELALIGEQLDWAIEGSGVHGHLIEMGTLNMYTTALRGLLRWTAQDIVVEEGMPRTEVTRWKLVEPVLAGTFDGSFGVRITRAPVTEHVEMFREPLFDRTVERLLTVLTTLNEGVTRTEVVEVVSRLRRNSISHLKALAQAIVASGAPSQVRWRGGDPITIMPATASELVDILEAVVEQDEPRVVVGRLSGGDYDDERFHLVEHAPAGTRPQEYRGVVDPSLRQDLERLHLNERVRATVLVTYADSPFTLEPSESYTLVGIEPVTEFGTQAGS